MSCLPRRKGKEDKFVNEFLIQNPEIQRQPKKASRGRRNKGISDEAKRLRDRMKDDGVEESKEDEDFCF